MKTSTRWTILWFLGILATISFPFGGNPVQAQEACVLPPSGMVSWWPFDEPSGNISLDIIGTNNGTNINNPVRVAGMVNGALEFDQTNYVEVPHNSSLDFGTNDFTVDAWINPSDPGTIVGKFNSSPVFNEKGFAISLVPTQGPPDPHLFLSFSINETADTIGQCDVLKNRWSHVALVFDRTSFSQVRCFVDGQFKDSAPLFSSASVNNNVPLFIGRAQSGGSVNFPGRIDEVEIFQRALDDSEIQGIFQAGSAGKCPPCVPAPSDLVSWWPGDGGAEDIQSKNDGTVQGGATFAPGLVGQAFSLGGVGNFIQVAANPSLDIGFGDFTIDGWIQPQNVAGVKTITDKRERSQIFDSLKGYHVFLSNGRLGLQLADNTFANYIVPASMSISPDNQWHFVSVSVQRSSVATFRVDQNEVSIPIAHPGSLANNAPFLIGGHSFNSGLVFDGNIDELELYNRALTPAEVLKIFGAGSSGKCKGCACQDPNAIVGTSDDDILGGTAGNDIICGFEGDDRIWGLGGNDCIDGGEGRDRTFGGPGDDRMFGGPGDDTMLGVGGDDDISGGDGDDRIIGSRGNDRLIGGSGNDRITGSSGNDTLRGGSGDDKLLGGPGNDTIDGGPEIDNCIGGALINCP